MILRKRKGMALITVVLIAALFLISIIGISAALVTSETGLSQILFNLRNTDFTDPGSTAPLGNLEYLTVGGARNIASNGSGYVLSLSEHSYSESTDKPFVTYSVKIKKIDGGTWDPDNPSEDPINVSLAIYSLGMVYSDSSKAEVLARRVISTECDAVFSIGTTSSLIDYGILAGGNIEFKGHATEEGGDIFANGNITSDGSTDRVTDGEAYAHGAIDEGIAPDGEHPGQATVNISEQFEQYTKDMAYAFKTGGYPYGGTEGDYPNTSEPIVMAVVQSYLGSDDTGNTLDEIQTFYSDLMEPAEDFNILTPLQLKNLQDNANNIVYYHEGDVKINNSATNLSNLKGIIVIEGKLTLAGNVDIGDSLNPDNPEFALIVRGEVVIKPTGTATLYGLLYAEDDITVSGTFDCYGAMVTEKDIELKGNAKVIYEDTGLNTAGSLEYDLNGIESANIGPSSWEEISYEESPFSP